MATTVMLAHKFQEGKHNPVGWWMSEKLDGVRAYWTGSGFFSRAGNKFEAPAFFCADLPKTPLDGELWCGRGLFHKTMSIIKKLTPSPMQQKEWEYVTYLVFDAPTLKEPYEKRVAWLQKNIDQTKKTTFAAVVGINKCESVDHLKKVLREVLLKGGEGVMLRQPGSFYENRRSHTLLKVKFFQDEEARVTGILPGTGRCSGMMGKLTCELPNGVQFKVGTGFSDAQRKNPPKVGSVISFKYQELSHHGNPRFPAFIRQRDDLTWADVLKAAKIKIPFSQIKKPEYQLNKQHSILFSTVPSRDSKGAKVVTTDDEDEEIKQASDDDEKPKKKTSDDGSKKKKDDGEARPKKKCMYGSLCYRTNKEHLDAFIHENVKSSKVAAAAKAGKEQEKVDLPTWALDDDDTPKKKKRPDSDEEEKPQPKKSKKITSNEEVKEKKPCMFGRKCFRRCKIHLAQYSHDTDEAHTDEEDEEDEDARRTEDEFEGEGEEVEESLIVPRREWELLQATMSTLESMVKGASSADASGVEDESAGSCFTRTRSSSSSSSSSCSSSSSSNSSNSSGSSSGSCSSNSGMATPALPLSNRNNSAGSVSRNNSSGLARSNSNALSRNQSGGRGGSAGSNSSGNNSGSSGSSSGSAVSNSSTIALNRVSSSETRAKAPPLLRSGSDDEHTLPAIPPTALPPAPASAPTPSLTAGLSSAAKQEQQPDTLESLYEKLIYGSQ